MVYSAEGPRIEIFREPKHIMLRLTGYACCVLIGKALYSHLSRSLEGIREVSGKYYYVSADRAQT